MPEGIELVDGQQKYFMQQLLPGKSAQLKVRSIAYVPGELKVEFKAASRGTEARQAARTIRVYQPQINIAASGPNLNFVDRDGIYTIQVDNVGQVDVNNVELAIAVPAGMKVTTVSREAKVDRETGILIWKFNRLAAGSNEIIRLKAVCNAAGRQVCKIAASSDETRAEKFDLVTDVRTRADLGISVASQGGPIEVGNQAGFAVTVGNQGSSSAKGVQVVVELPPSLKAIAQSGYTVSEIDNTIRFENIDLKPGDTKELPFVAVGVSEGEHVVRGILTMKDSKRRLIAEDSVFVFEVGHSKITESLKPEIRR